MPAYRMKCRNEKCRCEFHRYYKVEEFDGQQYGSGWACFNCGFPRMAVIKSNRAVKDTFVPGFQRNIGKVCNSYQKYKDEIKRMGLIEIGHEDIPEGDDGNPCYWDDETLKNVVMEGVEISGNEAIALKSGAVDRDETL